MDSTDQDQTPNENENENETEATGAKTSRELSRKQFIIGGAAAGAALGIGGGALGLAGTSQAGVAIPNVSVIAEAAEPDDIDLALINGKIYTMDPANPVVTEVLISNGRFVQVGNPKDKPGKDKNDTVKDKDAKVIDLKGKIVVPGIIDSHNHIVLMGNRPGYHTPLENAYSIADVQQLYAARAAGAPAGSWITTIGGFNPNHFAELRLPTLAELDAAVPNNPCFMLVGFTGPAATNTLGKAFFQSKGVTVSATGQIGTGGAQASSAMLWLRRTLLNPAERRRSTLDAIAYGLSVGVTTHLDQGAFQKTDTSADGAAHEDNFTMHLPFIEVHRQGMLKARVQINFLHMETDPNLPELQQRMKNQFQFFGDDVLMTGSIGEFIASGVGPNFQQAARLVAQAGWRAETHSLSTTDFMSEISAYELANAEFPITDKRWVVAHVPRITLEWVNRQKALGGALNMTGWQYLAGTLPTTDPKYAGPPFRLIVDSGIHSGMTSDGMQIAPMNPWLHMYYATTGLNARHVQINPNQQITREEVLRLYTASNGWFLRKEDDLGSIEDGQARRPRRPEQGLLHGSRRGPEEDPLGADRHGRRDRPRRRHRHLIVGVRAAPRGDAARTSTSAPAPEPHAGPVEPLLFNGSRVVVDGHPICDDCGRGVVATAPGRWRHLADGEPYPERSPWLSPTPAELRHCSTYEQFAATYPWAVSTGGGGPFTTTAGQWREGMTAPRRRTRPRCARPARRAISSPARTRTSTPSSCCRLRSRSPRRPTKRSTSPSSGPTGRCPPALRRCSASPSGDASSSSSTAWAIPNEAALELFARFGPARRGGRRHRLLGGSAAGARRRRGRLRPGSAGEPARTTSTAPPARRGRTSGGPRPSRPCAVTVTGRCCSAGRRSTTTPRATTRCAPTGATSSSSSASRAATPARSASTASSSSTGRRSRRSSFRTGPGSTTARSSTGAGLSAARKPPATAAPSAGAFVADGDDRTLRALLRAAAAGARAPGRPHRIEYTAAQLDALPPPLRAALETSEQRIR